MERLAVADLGSNSFRLVVYAYEPGRWWQHADEIREAVRISEGMGEDKIAAFYADPVKTACDAWSAAKAFSFRSVTLGDGIYWRAQRWARFIAGLGGGTLRRLRNRFDAGSGAAHHQAAPALERSI